MGVNVLGTVVWKLVASTPPSTTSGPTTITDLGTHDAGLLWELQSHVRCYRWTGSQWFDAPGQPQRGQICFFASAALPGAGWAICNGGATTISTTTGSTAPFTTPDLTTGARFIRSTAGATGGTGGQSLQTAFTDVAAFTTNTNSASQVVQSGTGVTVAAHTHVHDADPADKESDAFSIIPPYYELRPYVRL